MVACGCFVIFVGPPSLMLVVWFIFCVIISKACRVVTLSWSSTWGDLTLTLIAREFSHVVGVWLKGMSPVSSRPTLLTGFTGYESIP